MQVPLPPDEAARLDAVHHYNILDTAPEPEFDDLTHLAAQICGTPISAITLVDQDRQWFKSRVGLDVAETSRTISFCAHTILGGDLLLVSDTSADERFAANPFVTGERHIRFYGGVPLTTPEGQAVGSLCVLDTVPRQLDPTQQDALRRLGRQTVALLEARLDTHRLKASETRYRRLFEAAKDGILILDAVTGKIEDANPFLCQLLNYAPDDFIGKQLWEIGVFHDIAANQDAFRTLREKEYIRYDDLPLETSAGRSISVEFVSNVYLSGDKKVVQCNIRDVTERKQATALLIQNQQRLALATESAHIGIWDWDVMKDRLVWDAQMYALYGLRQTDFSGAVDGWQGKLHPDDRERAGAEIAAALDGSQDFDTQFRVVWPDGAVHHLKAHGLVQRADDGSALRMIGVNWDITESAEAGAQLHFQKTLLEAQMEASFDGILVVSDTKKILSYNQRFVQMWGIPPYVVAAGDDAALRQVIFDQVDDLQPMLERVAYLYEHLSELSQEEVLLHDGRVFDRYSSPITGASGHYYGRVWYFRDITARKQDEAALRRSEERYRSLTLATTQIVWVATADGVLEDMPAWRQYTGQSIDRVRGWDWMEALHPDDIEPTFKTWNHSLETATLYETEYRVRGADGVYRLFAVRGVPLRESDGTIREWVGTCTDIQDKRAAEEELDRFFTLSLDIMCIAGLDGYFKRVNPAFEEILGFTVEEILAKPFLNWSHPDDHQATLAAVKTLSDARPVVGFENRYATKDGSWRWLEWRSTAMPETGLIYAAARDVTQRKEAEAALLQMRDELEVRVAERTTALARANTALQIQIREREEAEAETRIRALQQEAVAELGRQALTEVDLDTLLNVAATLVATTLNVELSTIVEVTSNGESLRIRAGNGWDADIIGSEVPITTKSQSLHSLLSNTPTIVDDLRVETRFEPSPLLLERGMVSGVTVIIGGPEQPFGTLSAHTIRLRHFMQDDVNFLQATANVLAAAITQRRVEVEIRQLIAQLKATNEQLRIENVERQMALGTLREVTVGLEQAKEEAERAREIAEVANRAKSEFLSRMSHELRTPLNAILGFGQILGKQDLAPLPKESLGYILKGGHHLLDLVNEVLDIARVEAGRLEISLEPIALNDVVPQVCALLQPLAAQSHITLDEHISNLNRSYILADLQRLNQVLLNLISNAIKYNREGGLVEVSCDFKPDGWTAIAIRDTGVGISPQNLQKLFTPFERLGAGTAGIEGTGLGLVLSQRLVTAMGGRLNVESTLGQGTTFTIELPQAPSPEAQLANLPQAIHHVNAGKENQLSFSVLCIEDNPAHIRLLELIFQDRPKITLLTAVMGGAGLDLARHHEPDLILLDLNLPDMNGSEVLTRLQQSALTRDIPVVVISADATDNQIERLLAAGARACLTKPLDVDEFLLTLDQFLQMTMISPTQLNTDKDAT